jgi:hypothetical protein
MDTRQTRMALLSQWAKTIRTNAVSGALTGQPFDVQIRGICGPRAGALEVLAGIQSGPLLHKLRAHDGALLRQMVAWDFVGQPTAFMSGRRVRLEAGWVAGLSERMVRLSDLGQCPENAERWTVGKDEHGRRITTSLKDASPHWLLAGATGSGKTVAMRTALRQLAKKGNQLVLLDGKYGESLYPCAHLPGVVGPVATEVETARAALLWTCEEMRQRYERIARGGTLDTRLVVAFDEFQEWASHQVISDLMHKIAAQGRAAGVHLLAATQHPVVDAFGDSATRRELTGRVALMVTDAEASRVAVGSATPRADRLLGAGDCYVIAPGNCHRVQGAFVDEADFAKAQTGRWEFDEWPDCDAESAGQDLPVTGSIPTAQETAISLLSAMAGEGRPTFKDRFPDWDLPRPGNTKASRLLNFGREVWAMVKDAPELTGYCEMRQ